MTVLTSLQYIEGYGCQGEFLLILYNTSATAYLNKVCSKLQKGEKIQGSLEPASMLKRRTEVYQVVWYFLPAV